LNSRENEEKATRKIYFILAILNTLFSEIMGSKTEIGLIFEVVIALKLTRGLILDKEDASDDFSSITSNSF
jgi:predicted AAA+ superfamily ATPase